MSVETWGMRIPRAGGVVQSTGEILNVVRPQRASEGHRHRSQRPDLDFHVIPRESNGADLCEGA